MYLKRLIHTMRARSSVGLERHTTDVKVIGSNPFGPAIKNETKKVSVSASDPGLFCFHFFDLGPKG